MIMALFDIPAQYDDIRDGQLNVALMKIGARIHENDNCGNSTNEVLATVRLLRDGGAYVTGFTNILPSDRTNTSFPIRSYDEFFDNIDKYDKLIVVNGTANFYGGQDSIDVYSVYKAMHEFKKEIIYVLYDPYLGLKRCSRYPEFDLSDSNIHCVTQCRSTHLIKNDLYKSVTYFPLELFPLITEDSKFTEVDFDLAKYDLNYAGTFRGGRRKSAMMKFFFGLPDDIKVMMFGNLSLKDFDDGKTDISNPPEFGPAVPHNLVRENIMRGLSTVIIGDPLYCKLDDIAQRFAESIIYGQITFIDAEYDSNNRAYKDRVLSDYLRIHSKEELISNLREIKSDRSLFSQLLLDQRNDLLHEFDPVDYCKSLVNMIGGIR